MNIHTALLDLPDVLDELGLNYVVTQGWEYGQGNYLWTTPDGMMAYHNPPSGYMVHHTATSGYTPPPVDTSKANAWIGLLRDGRLYQTGGGTPTIVLSSAGPCRISSGYGYRPAAWDYTFNDLRAPLLAGGPDTDTALNRYVFNVEVIHRGDGGPLDVGVWNLTVGLGVALQQMFPWTERTLGHKSWSRRKIDPNWSVGLPNDGGACIIDIQDAIAATPADCVPDWYSYDEYWQPYIDAVWPGGAPGECEVITQWQMSVILKKLGLT